MAYCMRVSFYIYNASEEKRLQLTWNQQKNLYVKVHYCVNTWVSAWSAKAGISFFVLQNALLDICYNIFPPKEYKKKLHLNGFLSNKEFFCFEIHYFNFTKSVSIWQKKTEKKFCAFVPFVFTKAVLRLNLTLLSVTRKKGITREIWSYRELPICFVQCEVAKVAKIAKVAAHLGTKIHLLSSSL